MTNENAWPPKMAVCVGTVVLKDDKVLLIRQAKGTSLEGRWSIPWGVVDLEERPEVAALRETVEEGGITAAIEGFLGLQNLQRGWIGLVFLCNHVSGEPKSDGGVESDAAAYLSMAEIEGFEETIEPWCKWIALRVLKGEHSLIKHASENPDKSGIAFL